MSSEHGLFIVFALVILDILENKDLKSSAERSETGFTKRWRNKVLTSNLFPNLAEKYWCSRLNQIPDEMGEEEPTRGLKCEL